MATTTPTPVPAPDEHHDDFTGDPTPHKPADDREQIYFEGSPMLRAEMARGWIWVIVGLVVVSAPIIIHHFQTPGNAPSAGWWFAVAAVIGLIFILIPWIKSKT